MMLHLYRKPRKRRKIGPEASLQYTVIQYLNLQAPKGTIYFCVPNEGKRSEAAGAHLKRMGMLPGVSDLCIVVPGQKACFLELKARGEKQSDDQKAFEELCQRNGSAYAVVDNIDDALCVLRYWGVLPRNARAA